MTVKDGLPNPSSSTDAYLVAKILGLAAFLFLVIVIAIAAHHPWLKTAFKDGAELGQLGDFFGGLLNPLLSFITLCAFLYTLKLQGDQLKISQIELRLAFDALTKSTHAQEELARQTKDQNDSLSATARAQKATARAQHNSYEQLQIQSVCTAFAAQAQALNASLNRIRSEILAHQQSGRWQDANLLTEREKEYSKLLHDITEELLSLQPLRNR